jgi:hypothetical protein
MQSVSVFDANPVKGYGFYGSARAAAVEHGYVRGQP